MERSKINRRIFVGWIGASALETNALAQTNEPLIDIHQHTPYSGRTADELVAHQRKMGITKTILLPAGRKYGLAAGAGGNDECVELCRRYPKEFVFCANEMPNIPETRDVITKYLKMGAIGIGEQKFPVDSDSPHIHLIAQIAQEFQVPVLLHFQYNTYNLHFDRFYKILEKYPKVNFIGHAQTWWSNIDIEQQEPALYPKGKVSPGGISSRYLKDYPNMFGDLSAGSGLNALLRDEAHAREFLRQYQDKLLYGSDCSDKFGQGEKCSGSQQLAAVRRLLADKTIERKLLYGNAARVFKLG